MSASKFTPTTRGALIERTAAGVSLPDACRALDLRLATVKGWITRGHREKAGAYTDFASAVEAARDAAHSRPEPMDEDELARVVSGMARGGSVQAAKLRWEMLIREAEEEEVNEDDPLAEFDEIARRNGGARAVEHLGVDYFAGDD
jgi:hypothetical protein